MLEFTANKVYILDFLLTIFFVFYGVKIAQNKQNAQNAHLIERMGVESIQYKQRSSKMKVSNKQLQTLISTGIISTEQGEEMISKGLASGFSRGKIEVCKNVGNFLDIFNQLEVWFNTYETEINEEMSLNGLPPVKKVSINIAK